MKSLTRTIIVLVIVNLAMGDFVPAQAEGSAEPTVQTRSRDRELKRTFTISGRTGIEDVEMQGLPGIVVTDENGYYSATVIYGWSGTVRPTKKGYAFKPATMIYRKITNNQANQYYIAELITYTISNVIMLGGSPIQGVLVSASNGGGSDITNAQGRFSVKVPYGWSGEITLSKEGFEFPSKSYANITENYRDDLPESLRSVSRRRRTVGRTGGRKVLVIPATADVKNYAEELDAITQDLQVMSYILDEKFKELHEVEGLFVDFGDFFRRDRRDPEAIYLGGYGALFLMEANFAFTRPPKAQEQEDEETAEDVDPTWQRARQKVFSLEEPMMGRTRRTRSRKEYGAVGLKQLNTELIKMLKHAANIRILKQDEWVILTVITVIGQGEAIFNSLTAMTVRAKKSDVDDFAKGKLDFKQFRQKVQHLIR